MTDRYGKLVVGYDGTDEGSDALALARILAGDGGRLIAACVAPLPHFHRGHSESRAHLEAQAAGTLEDLDGAVDTRAVVARSAAQGLFELAADEHADLLVVGSSHRGGLGAVAAGSVGRALLQGAPCAVAVTPRGYRDGDPDRLRVIGVGYDGMPESEAALEGAIRLALAAGTTIRVMTVVPPAVQPSDRGRVAREPSVRDQMQERLQAAVERCPRELRALPVVVTGDAIRALIDEAAKGVDLLVVGSRGFGPLMRVMLGSVADQLMRSGPCPVLVFPRGGSTVAGSPPPQI